MKSTHAYGLAIAIAATLLAMQPRSGSAQDFGGEAPADQAAPTAESYYRNAAPSEDKLTVAREKAMARGQQRMARLEAMRWYGFSNSRPTAAAMPYTTMYSPAWQQPGGRPFAWYTSSRPIVIYAGSGVYR